MAVRVEREGDRRVPEHLTDELDVDTAREEHRRRAVAHVMEANHRESDLRRRHLEGRRLIARVERGADGIAEHEVGIGPCRVRDAPVEVLPVPVRAERVDRPLAESDAPPRPRRLGRLEHESLPALSLQRAADRDRRGGDVHVAPLQPEQLALSHPGCERQHVEGMRRMLSRGDQERVDLLRDPDRHLRPGRLRTLRAVARVPHDHVPAHRLHERAVQDAVRAWTRLDESRLKQTYLCRDWTSIDCGRLPLGGLRHR